MNDTRRTDIDQRVRHLLHRSTMGQEHLGVNPLASQLTGPMRRDYRLRRFLSLAASTAPDRRSADPA